MNNALAGPGFSARHLMDIHVNTDAVTVESIYMFKYIYVYLSICICCKWSGEKFGHVSME